MPVKGLDLAYVEKGDGEAVVFVHGGFSDYRSWDSQLKAISESYRAISYSLRYHYPNPWKGDGTDYALPVHASDLASLIETLHASPAHIVGTSFGGRVALHLARDRPKLVKTLILAEPGLGAWLQNVPGGPGILSDMIKNYFEPGEKAIQDGDLEGAVRFFVNGVAGDGWYERLPEEVRRRYQDNIRVQGIPTIPSPFSREDAQKISAPVLLVNGELSPKLFRLVVDELEKALPHARRVVIPGVSHLMTIFDPEAFNKTLLSFLKAH